MTEYKYVFRRVDGKWRLDEVQPHQLNGLKLYDLKLLVEKIYAQTLSKGSIKEMLHLIKQKMN